MEQLHADLLVLVLAVLFSHFSWLPVTLAQQQSTQTRMKWVSASNPEALCNDFTQAGFFIRQNQSSNNWVVFLESGGLCYSTESCNRRFFVRKVMLLLINVCSNFIFAHDCKFQYVWYPDLLTYTQTPTGNATCFN